MIRCTAVCQLNIGKSNGRVGMTIVNEDIIEFYVYVRFSILYMRTEPQPTSMDEVIFMQHAESLKDLFRDISQLPGAQLLSI